MLFLFQVCKMADFDINSLSMKEIKVIIDKLISKFFSSCSIPFRCVDSDAFKELVETLILLNPDKSMYKPPGRKALAKRVLKALYVDFDEQKKKHFENTESILETDGWKNSSANRKFMVFTMRNKYVQQAYLTSFDTTTDSENADFLGTKITEGCRFAFEKYGTKVVGITNDNDSSIKAGAELARDIDGNKLMLATCYSHSGNLLIKTLVLLDPTLTEETRQVINAFGNSKMAALIKDAGGKKLKNFPDTRFCFFRNTCEGVLNNLNKGTLQNIAREHDVADRVEKLIRSNEFRSKLRSSIQTLNPICKLINACQDPSKNIADGSEMWLRLELDNPDHTVHILERIHKAISNVGYAANLMHQKYMGQRLDDDQRFVANEFLKSKFDEKGKAELQRFLDGRDQQDDFADNCPDPIPYWRIKKLKFPTLAKLCIKLFLFPASTASIEGYFSLWTYVHNHYRNRLGFEKSCILTDLFHMSRHLKKGEWVNTPEKRKRKYTEFCADDSDDDVFADEDDTDEHDNANEDEDNSDNYDGNYVNPNYMHYLLDSDDDGDFTEE